MNADNADHNNLTIPLIESLTADGIEIIRQAGGFPNNWNDAMISLWLAEYDRITIERHQLNNGRWTLRTENDGMFQNVNHITISLPIQRAFFFDAVSALHRMLLNMDLEENDQGYAQWFEYINAGGADRLEVSVRIYNPNIHPFVINNNDANNYVNLVENMNGLNLNIFGNNVNQH